MNLEVTKYLPIRDLDKPIDGFFADYFITKEPDLGFVAQGFICAPGLGDEMMTRLASELNQQVVQLGEPITEIFVADCIASARLAEPTPGYAFDRVDERGRPVFVKVYGDVGE